MSKPYRIRLSEMIVAEDSARFQLEVPPFSTKEDFQENLLNVLSEAGWQKEEDIERWSFQIDEEMRYIFEPETMSIRTEIRKGEFLDEELKAWSLDELDDVKREFLEKREKMAQEMVRQRLEETQAARRKQCEAWSVQATAQALKHVASQLGEVREWHEEHDEEGGYRLTITIEDEF